MLGYASRAVVEDLLVVLAYDAAHIRAGAVADFDGAPVEQLPEFVVSRKVLVYE